MVSEDTQRTIGRHLTQWRERAGMCLVESSSKLHIPVTIIKGVEAGLIRTPSPLLESFAQVYEATETELRLVLALGSEQKALD